ncbi:MAG: methylmalonyl Co-A mutase-associated GTPase MeaB [Alphaproteobacteria bacterium]|nr:methylmalonyl Co-A mutase-associated GTPase MeaB [Alphaproteobacteria bacterium]
MDSRLAPGRAPRLSAEARELLAGVRKRNIRAIARAISLAESGQDQFRALAGAFYRAAGRAHVVGLTGVPGSGKSTMVRALARALRDSGRTVGIVAVDPSSPFSGGAILGDRVRMTEISGDPGVFIRSMATRGALGGLSAATLDAVDVLDAAGFDVVLIETVGVGQDEVDIVRAAHTVAVVSAPGLGDEIQAIKAGVLEIADIHVVSKCDRSDANKTISDLKGMLALETRMGGRRAGSWTVKVVPTSAEKGQGIGDLLKIIDDHRQHLQKTGEMAVRRRHILETRILKTAEDIVRARFRASRESHVADVIERVAARKSDPHAAAVQLLRKFHKD